MARLARSVYVEFPEHRHYFGRRSLTFQGSTKANTNHLLPVYSGMNGLKTGRTYGSGFHLIGSAERGGDHLIAVVMGCGSKSMRDRTTAGLLDLGFGRPRAETGAQ
jgi:D-alanyl-D-alanine carboxypeptidase